jgi:hypothetical protein
MLFDRLTGGLRNLDYEEICLWRELVILVRDAQWQTVASRIVSLHSTIEENRFAIKFCAETMWPSIRFEWQATILGDENGTIDYRFTGEAKSSFQANRIGFCLMHPAEHCAGQAIRQHRVDGQTIDGYFPKWIEPQIVGCYSICKLRALEHEFTSNDSDSTEVNSQCSGSDKLNRPGWARAEFDGEVFETEDQRNWSDASFKTYCTPLEKPFPVSFAIGDHREQRVRLSFMPPRKESSIAKSILQPSVSTFAPQKYPFAERKATMVPSRAEVLEDELISNNIHSPEFGLVLCAAGSRFPEQDRNALCQVCELLAVDTLRYDLVLPSLVEHQLAVLDYLPKLVETVTQAGCKLELALQLPWRGEVLWRPLGERLVDFADAIGRLLVYRGGVPTTRREDLQSLRLVAPAVAFPIGGGSDAHFCELNRDQALGLLPFEEMDFVAWSLCPMVHADDDLTLMENVQSLPAMLSTARQFSSNKPLIVTPISLKPRFNAVASHNELSTFAKPESDRRQVYEVTATWSRRVLQQLSAGDVASVTWFEVFGERGIAHSPDSDHLSPSLFPVGKEFRNRAKY